MTFKPTYSDASDGFVLPYVLLVIAILSVSLTLIAQRIMNTSTLMSEIEAQFQGNIALNSAEAETVYALMTSVPVIDGYELNPSKEANLFEMQEERVIPADIWSAKGGLRQSLTPHGTVVVELRDGSGFIPLNSIDAEEISGLARSFGLSSQKQKSLTAKLQDYIDTDSRRLFLGAERADYRLRQMPPPTNASLRKIGELNNIMEWQDLLNDVGPKALWDRVTLNPKVQVTKKNFVEPSLARSLAMEYSNGGDVYDILKLDKYPTDVIRLRYYYQTDDGKIMRRNIEVDKTIGLLRKPFSRQLLYQDTLETLDVEGDLNRMFLNLREGENVIYAETYRYKQ